MPNCFQLLRDGVVVSLNDVDAEMCHHFGEPCDPFRYLWRWYDIIGYDLAKGRSFSEIKATLATTYANCPMLMRIAEWLEATFVVRAWSEQKSWPREF